MSWAACGPGGEERRPSFLAQRLLRIFSDLTVSREERDGQFALEAPRPALEQAGWNPRARRALDGLPEYAGALERQDRAEHWGRGTLSRSAADRLYGRRVAMSASRMDNYRSCHFA